MRENKVSLCLIFSLKYKKLVFQASIKNKFVRKKYFFLVILKNEFRLENLFFSDKHKTFSLFLGDWKTKLSGQNKIFLW